MKRLKRAFKKFSKQFALDAEELEALIKLTEQKKKDFTKRYSYSSKVKGISDKTGIAVSFKALVSNLDMLLQGIKNEFEEESGEYELISCRPECDYSEMRFVFG